jgi:hypothetical protein
VLSILPETFLDLHAQLARWREDEHANAMRAGLDVPESLLEQTMENRKGEARCFPCSGLRETDKVAPAQRVRNGLPLNGGRARVTRILHRFEQLGNKTEIFEAGERFTRWRLVSFCRIFLPLRGFLHSCEI